MRLATAKIVGKITITKIEEIVPLGALDPDQIHTPGVFVQRIFKAPRLEKRIENRTISN
jgi:3-oxoacid CoA-transferase subunit A